MVRLEAPELLMLKYGSMSFSPFTVNRFDVPGSPLRLKFPYPPVTFTVTPGTVKATFVMSPPAAGNCASCCGENGVFMLGSGFTRSEEHTSELQSLRHLVCRLLLE